MIMMPVQFCVCTGTLQDADNDNVCDAEDQCPGFDDNIDIDEDGIPDNCDPDVDCSGIVCNDNNNCTVNDVYDSNCNCSGVSIDNNGNCNISDLYCEPTTNQAGLFIEKVVIGNIDNQSGSDDGYGDYSNQYALLTAPGETINAELVLNEDTGFGNNWTVWIDFNQNSTFEDSEKVIEGNGIQLNTTFTIPANASIGTTLMRVLGNIVLFGGTKIPVMQE